MKRIVLAIIALSAKFPPEASQSADTVLLVSICLSPDPEKRGHQTSGNERQIFRGAPAMDETSSSSSIAGEFSPDSPREDPCEETFGRMASRTRDRAGIPSRLIVFRGLWFPSAMPVVRSKTQRRYNENDVPGSGLTTLTSRS